MRFSIGWIVVGGLWAVNASWLALGGLEVTGSLRPLALIAGIGLAAFILRSRLPRISGALHGLTMNLALSPASFVFTYLCATPAFPLVDDTLATADRAIGFDWMWWYALVANSPTIFRSLGVLYFVGWILQTVALPLFLPAFSPRRNTELVFTFTLSLAVTAIIAMRFPAEGAIFHNLSSVGDVHSNLINGLRDFTALRNGSLTVINYSSAYGIIAFPSFHTATAILYTYAVRGSGRLFRFMACLNGLMLPSIPVFGGHYLFDMLAGAVVAAVAIFISRVLVRAIERTTVPMIAAEGIPVTPA